MDELVNALRNQTQDKWIGWKSEIRALMGNLSPDAQELDRFLTAITETGFKEDPIKTREFIAACVDKDQMLEAVRFKERGAPIPFEGIEELANELAPLYPATDGGNYKRKAYLEWRRLRPVALSFIPNLINLFLGAFNFLDVRKRYTTLWEKHLLLEIVYKLFIIPYVIYKILEPFVDVTVKVYLLTAAIIASVGILISIYQRWLRPVPDEIVNCTNLDKQVESGVIEPKVGQAAELKELIAALEADSHVLLVGRSGEGKTALVHHLLRMKHHKKLPEKIQKLAMFEVDCGMMISSVSFGHSELINQTKDQNEGFENDILLFFDEFFQIASNKEAFKAFKKRFLEDKPQTKFVATATLKEYKEIQKLDMDGSFRRRVVPILIDSSSNEQNLLVIRELVSRTAKDILVTEKAIEAVIDRTSSDDYLPDIGKPAKAVKLMMDAIGVCRSSFNPHYLSDTVSEERQKYQNLKLQAEQHVKIPHDLMEKIRKQAEKIEKLEQELAGHRSSAKEIQRLLHMQQAFKTQCFNLTHRIAEASKERQLKAPVDGQDQAVFLWLYYYAVEALKKEISDKVSGTRASLPVQVDEQLIDQVFSRAAKIEQLIGEEASPCNDPMPQKVEIDDEEILDDDD